jgi:hypothetical protein
MSPPDSTGDLPPVSGDLPPISGATTPEVITGELVWPGPLPERVGPYKVLGLLASGGMGLVYLAEQERPRRRVALKVMKPGTASPEGLRRFEYEAQALARLDHRGIARIYEAGTANTGPEPQPYFAMELIQGRPLTAFVTAQGLDTRARLRLLIEVCRAVDCAHEQWIIHRDLKPANILVDNDGQPKVLDFGVARVRDSDLPAATLETDAGKLLGTLPYMSPEQAAGNPRDVDKRTDVYALGVILYQLLAGKLPYDLKGKAIPAAVRTLTEEEPVPLRSVNKAFRGDLDTIVARALEKDKNRRYPSAGALAADLECYLEDRPVKARPAGVVYRLRKFAKRNRILVSAALVLVLALAGLGWLGMTAMIHRERALLAEKEKARLQADGYVQDARLATQRGQWRLARANYDKALAAGHQDAVELRLNKVRAALAGNDFRRAAAEITALAAAPDLGDREGSVLLIQGDIFLRHDEARAEQLLRRALRKKLSPAEAAYARALLAQTTPEAVRHLRWTLQLDPYQPRARALLELLLVLLARLPEARLELTAHEALFPEDASARVLRALVLALDRKLAAANRVLNGLQPQWGNADVAAVKAVARLLAELRNPANRPDPVTGLPDLRRHLAFLAPVLPRLWQVPAGVGPNEVLAAHRSLFQTIPLPPQLRKGLLSVLQALGKVSKDAPGQGLAEIQRAADLHPEGTILYLRAATLFGSLRFAAAEKAALAAADTPALLPVRRHALLMAVAAEGFGYTLRKDPALLRKGVKNLREVLALGPLPTPFQNNLAVSLALLAREYSLARQLLDDWDRQTPGHLQVLHFRAKTEQAAGAYGPALEAAEKVLRQKPGDVQMRRVKKEAVKKLLEQVRPFLPAAATKRAP